MVCLIKLAFQICDKNFQTLTKNGREKPKSQLMKNLLNSMKKQRRKPKVQLMKNLLNSMKKQGGKSKDRTRPPSPRKYAEEKL